MSNLEGKHFTCQKFNFDGKILDSLGSGYFIVWINSPSAGTGKKAIVHLDEIKKWDVEDL